MEIQNLPIEQLINYKLNAKTHPESQILGIAESMRRFGVTQPAVVDKDKNIIIGHARVEAAKRIGMTEFPCVVQNKLTEFEVKALRLIDNRISEQPWDVELLSLDMSGIEFDFENFNIKFDHLIAEVPEGIESEGGEADNDGEVRYQVVVDCEDQFDQQKLFDEFKNRGLNCKMKK